MSNNSVWYVLDELFKKLDNAQILSNTIFSNEDDKQKYETKFMYAFRKYQAAKYHYNNVKDLIKLELNAAKNFLKDFRDLPDKSFFAEMTYESSADHYIFEFAAFLEALKSSIDFLAAACQPHLRGVQLDSIKTLIRQVENDKTSSIYNIIKKNLKWLKDLRDYRHHVVHRRIITIKSLLKLKIFNDSSKLFIHPILIPELPPSYVHDTRKSRMEEDLLENKSSYTEKKIIMNGKIIDYNLEFLFPKNFIPIEKFMEKYLNLLKNFFIDFILEISTFNFKMI